MAKQEKKEKGGRSAYKGEKDLNIETAVDMADWWQHVFEVSGVYSGQDIQTQSALSEASRLFGYAEPPMYPQDQGDEAETRELQPIAGELNTPPFPGKIRDELRLDVDGRYPLMTASGRIQAGVKFSVHWIASLVRAGRDTYKGKIWYKDAPGTPFPFTHIEIDVQRSWYSSLTRATVTFINGRTAYKREYKFRSRYFHPLSFEYDYAAGTTPITTTDTHLHPTHPSDLPQETISIEMVYRRAGFDVRTGGQGEVPLLMAGANQIWNDNELHDAMQAFWSRFLNAPQWAAWILFAAAHEEGAGLAGIMFDDIGPNHRQGTSVFLNSTLFVADPGIIQPNDWAQRYKFWCACHELGHCFNLAHSWQKDFPTFGSSWIPLTNDTTSTGFMNYPFYYPNGPYSSTNSETDYFSNFRYRFDNSELLFLRHAPIRFVQPGNADWFDHHGFRQAATAERPVLSLEVRANRNTPVFQYLEPIVLELKLKNVSKQPVIVDAKLLARLDTMTIIIKKDGKLARQFSPYAHYDLVAEPKVLGPGEAAYESLFVSAGLNGWDIADPGYYTVQVCLHLIGQDVVSSPLRLRIEPPRERDEEHVAQDLFSQDVGRILAFDGSRTMDSGLKILRDVVERLADHVVSYHANIALASSEARDYKLLKIAEPDRPFTSASAAKGEVIPDKPNVKAAGKEFIAALTANADRAAESLGHVDFKWYADRFADWLVEQGQSVEASKVQDTVHKTFEGRGVLKSVLDSIAEKRDSYSKTAKK